MSDHDGFALWLTGIPASGKSSITGHLVNKLRDRGIAVIVLESDRMRRILTPEPDYTDAERDLFYHQLTLLGELIIQSGVNVIFDATGNRRAYRDEARASIRRFIEIYIECPVEVCMRRDPKGIYAEAALKKATTVPGLQVPYEPPSNPELSLDGQKPPLTNAEIILSKLKDHLYI